MAWLPPVVTVAPAVEPVSLAEAKAQCHIDSTDFDTELAIYIEAAREHVEQLCGKLITQTVVMRAASFADLAKLPTAPVQSVTSVTYLDTDGAEQTLSTDVYEGVLIGLEPSIRLKINQSWPSIRCVSDAVRVTAVCGYGAAGSDVPAPIRQAMLLLIGDAFNCREDTNIGNIVNSIPNGVQALLSNYRIF